jgi:hypothetical protein
MPAKRRLEDLYVVGREVVVDDQRGDPVVVWLQKLNPVELNSVMRIANAARARVRSVRSDKNSDEYMSMWLDVLDWEQKEDLVEYLVAESLMRIQERHEAELAAEEEWSKDDYLQGLRDAWEGGLKDQHMYDPDDVEVRRVLSELQRFSQAAEERAADDVAAARAELAAQPMSDLQEQALDRVINYKSNAAWLDEFHRGELLYGVRQIDDHKAYYFTKRADLDLLTGEVLSTLYAAYSELSVDVTEGKDSEGTPTSSDSSEPPAEAETGVSSGLATVGR